MKAFILAGAFLFAFGFSAVTADAESSIKKSGWFGSVGVGLLSPDLPDGDLRDLVPDGYDFSRSEFLSVFARDVDDISTPDVGSGPISRFSIGYNAALSYGSFQVEGEFGFGGNDFSGSDYSIQSYGVNLRYVLATIEGTAFPFIGFGTGEGKSELKLRTTGNRAHCAGGSESYRFYDGERYVTACIRPSSRSRQQITREDVIFPSDVKTRAYKYAVDDTYFSFGAGLIVSPETFSIRAVIEYRHYDFSDDISGNAASITLQVPF